MSIVTNTHTHTHTHTTGSLVIIRIPSRYQSCKSTLLLTLE